ncbi:MAG: aldose 1-epimerase family protein [Balneolaceae bacterium]
MNHSLNTPALSIEVTKTGIELCSIKSITTGKEYMWQADPKVWESHAPVLFPIIGALKNGEAFYKGTSYKIPKHGLIRNSEKIKLIEQTNNSLRFSLKWDEESLKLYPFKFEIQITYTIIENTIQISHLITNHGDETMLYSLGGHPAFNCPLYEGESYEDYFLEFEEEETDSTWLLNSNGLTSGEITPILEHSNILPLHKNLFNNDALIFKNLKSKRVSLNSRISGEILAMEFEDFDYLGVWAKPNAPFVCIEPWLGITDSEDSDQSFENKEGLLQLLPKQSNKIAYSIQISE